MRQLYRLGGCFSGESGRSSLAYGRSRIKVDMSVVLPVPSGRVKKALLAPRFMHPRFGGWAMKPLMVGLCALGIWSAVADQAHAAWNNVFQPTLFGRNRTTTNYYVAP